MSTLKWRELRKVKSETYREWRDSGDDYAIVWRNEFVSARSPKFMPLRVVGEKKLSLTRQAPAKYKTFEEAAAACERHANPVASEAV